MFGERKDKVEGEKVETIETPPVQTTLIMMSLEFGHLTQKDGSQMKEDQILKHMTNGLPGMKKWKLKA